MVTAYLVANPNPNGDHFYRSRRLPILAIVEHITAGLEDFDFVGPDHSAEKTARYAATTNRSVSWHQGTDTDGTITLLPDRYTAFHVRNYNSCTLGREISKRNTDWRTIPARARDATLGHAAVADADWCRRHHIPVRKASRRDLDAAIDLYRRTGEGAPVGFIGHTELDPTRRSDPGMVRSLDTFPWHSYLELVAHHLEGSALQEAPFMLDTHEARDAYVRNAYRKLRGQAPTEQEVAFWVWSIAIDRANALNLIIDLTVEARRAS